VNCAYPLLLALGVAVAGAAATLGVGAIAGMPGGELGHLGLLLAPAIALTTAATAIAARLVARFSLRSRLLAVALVAALVGLANLAALAALMSVSNHDAAQIAVLLLYSMAAGVSAALVTARASRAALERLAATAARLAEGDLKARTGDLRAGPELDALAAALDEMAARLDDSIERERAADAQRRNLIIAVSHDLRTPLAGLRAMVEAIDDRVVEDIPTMRRYAAEMQIAVDSLVALVDDLFELVRLEAGAIQTASRQARLDEVVQSALAACDAQATEKGLALETRLSGAGAVPCSAQMTRVVQNLLQNAIRHTGADGTVRVEARRTDGRLEIVVQDSGEGIEQAAMKRIFEPFWRGDAARSGDGSGLGLALAKRIVEALGGRIDVESRPAEGSRFAVILPDPS
jgi:signal transduction histidine kinase